MNDSDQGSRRPIRRILTGLLAVAVVAALAWRLAPSAERQSPAHEPAPETAAADPANTDDPTPETIVIEPPAGVVPASFPANPPDDEPAVAHYRRLTRYPASTRRIDETTHDLLGPNARHEKRQRLPGPDDGEWEVLFTADRYAVRGPESVLASLEVWRDGEPQTLRDVTMWADALDAAGVAASINLAVADDGLGASTRFTPDTHWPEFVGRVRVGVTFSTDELEPRTGALDFYFTGSGRIPATFTGEFGDRLSDGDLLVEVGVDVRTAGDFRIEGNLYDADGRPFGWASWNGTWTPGRAVAPLRFHGLVFHDAEARPPYTLRQLRGQRLRPGDVPHREDMPDAAGAWVTSPHYEMSAFRSDEHDSPKRQKMMEMYRDAIARGVKLTRPEYLGDGGGR